MKSIAVFFAALIIMLCFINSGSLSRAADVPGKKAPRAAEGFEGKTMVFSQWDFQIMVPARNWQITENNDETIPLELAHSGGTLIQLMIFPGTMTTVDEVSVSLNRRFENNFSRDGVKDYKITCNREYRSLYFAGRRVMAAFTSGKGSFVVDQIYLEGRDRVFVLVMTGSRKVHDAAKKDFEGMALSLFPLVEKDFPREKDTKEQDNVQDSGKGSDR